MNEAHGSGPPINIETGTQQKPANYTELFGVKLLKAKYNLHQAREVVNSPRNIGKNVIPEVLIENYLSRYSDALNDNDLEKRKDHIEGLKRLVREHFIIRAEEVPQSYFNQQAEILREQGYGQITIGEEAKKQLAKTLIGDQVASINKWIDYLASDEAPYPTWYKYFVLRNILQLKSYDSTKKSFGRRSKNTVSPYPEINHEAIAIVYDLLLKQNNGHGDERNIFNTDKSVSDMIKTADFPKLYALASGDRKHGGEQLIETRGEWRRFDKNGDHHALSESLQGKGTGWCTATESTAQIQLSQGDFYVYYSLDDKGNSTVPRAAIRMYRGKIAEVRGIAEKQNLDPYINEIVEKNCKNFPTAIYTRKRLRI